MHRLPGRAPRAAYVHVAFAVVACGALAAYAAAPRAGQTAVLGVVIAVSTAAGAWGTWLARAASRPMWGLATVGLFLQLVLLLAWPRFFHDRLGRGDAQLADVCIAGAHLVLLMASVMLVRRYAVSDPGGVVDAALLGLLACTPLWHWLVLPQLQANGASLLGQVLVLADLLFLAGVLGSLGRMAAMNRRARPTLAYLLAAPLSTMAAVTGGVLAGGSSGPAWHMGPLIVAFLTYGAAALHPAAASIAVSTGRGYRGLTRAHLVFLGAVLMATPVAAVIQTVSGRTADPLVLAAGSVLAVPLVLLRVGQLSAQRERVERILAHHARHDDLTGLLNRRAMLEEIDRALSGLRDGAFDSVALYFCDLDGFKPVNDRLGHQAGDELLQVVARRLVACTRDVDALARLGGDEFVLLCPGGLPEAVPQVADRLVGLVSEPVELCGAEAAVGVSVGWAVATRGTPLTRDGLMQAADAAMYRRKHERRAAGRSPVVPRRTTGRSPVVPRGRRLARRAATVKGR